MKQILSRWRRIPRKNRAILNTVLITALCVLLYLSVGSPTLTPEQGLRRAEKIHMVGPGEIIDTLGWKETAYWDTLIVAKTGHGVSFYGERTMYTDDWPQWPNTERRVPTFSYREISGDMAVVAAPTWALGYFAHEYGSLPVYLFHNYPEAARAELEIDICGKITAESSLTGDRFFRFLIGGEHTAVAPEVLDLLSDISSGRRNQDSKNQPTSVPVTVRLYDAEDTLIAEKVLNFISPADQAHMQRGSSPA